MRDNKTLIDIPLNEWTDEELLNEYGDAWSLSSLPQDIIMRIQLAKARKEPNGGETYIDDIPLGTRNMFFRGEYQKTAANWRNNQNDETASTGVVLLWEGKVIGWKNELSDAHLERPLTVAVNIDGHVFQAEGGTDETGAKCWVAL
mgnify:CR=1 FL=1